MNKLLYGFLWAMVILLMASAALYVTMPISSRNSGWPQNVLRNWEEYGLRSVGGQLAYNPGGFELNEPHHIYGGHRAFSLYPSYWIRLVSTGVGCDGIIFYLVLTFLLVFSILHLFSGGDSALLAASIIPFCPGYIRNVVVLDPLAIPVLFGLPVMVCIIRLLQRQAMTRRSIVSLIGLVAIYAFMNWTTVFTFIIAIAYLAVALRDRQGRLLLFTLVAGACIIVVTAISVVHKMGGENFGIIDGLKLLYNSYLFGPGGYAGYPMNWSKAIIRLTVANLIGLLPLVILCLWAGYRSFKRKTVFEWASLLPFGMALTSIVGMRNYFAHHPWMAAPVLILGCIFSMALMTCEVSPSPSTQDAPQRPTLKRTLWAFLVFGCFVYCYFIILVFRINSAGEDALISLIWKNSARHDVVVVSHASDPQIADNTKRWSELFDRKVVTVEDWNAIQHSIQSNSGVSVCQLTSVKRPDPHGFIGKSEIEALFGQIPIQRLLNWYRVSIARREAGDRLQIESTYYLYRVENGGAGKAAGPH